jgi:uncharacterized membrane protein
MADSETTRRKRAQEIAAMFAIAVIPRTFQRSLLPRSSVDQGAITSITVVLVYLLGLLTQDVIEATSKVIVDQDESSSLSRQSLLFISAATVGIGVLGQRLNKYSAGERLPHSATRTVGKWVQYAGTAGLIIEAVEAANYAISKNKKAARARDLLPYFMGAGLLYTLVGEYSRSMGTSDFSLKRALREAKPARVIGITAGVTALVGSLVYAERKTARKIDAVLDTSTQKLKLNWLPLGHLIGVGAISGALYMFIKKTYDDIEQNADDLETGFTDRPTSTYLSGGPDSAINWSSLSLQGRRHIATALTPAQITAVMHGDAMQPVRIFVGIDSADTEEERVELALAELERTGAFERAYIVVVSPTGTGYVNYVMSESVEYQTRGNVASVTMQYSKRPSPMSLDRVDEGHIQYRMLLNRISKRLQGMPAKKRPRILLFGESLGAWTSQDALMHSGTDGLRALQIDRALWIGTPKGSKWKEQVLANTMLNTDKELVGLFDSYEDVEKLDKSTRDVLRYVMVTHYNDPIAQFGLEMLIKQPEWVADESKRPKGMSSNTKYRSPTLFVQTLIDMKNALKPIPGEFVANGHDYRADLARFVAFAYGFKVTRVQLTAIEEALRANEIVREARIKGET